MYYALDNNKDRIEISDAIKGQEYFCPCCNALVTQKKGNVNEWHYAHKKLVDCDKWYEFNTWVKDWQDKFKVEHREIIVEHDNKKRRASIKVDTLIIQLQSKSMTSSEFDERVEFFNSDNNHLVWLVDLRDKDIEYKGRPKKTEQYVWKRPYKFNNIDYFGSTFDLFFQIEDNIIIKVVWNKEEEFKRFGGYSYDPEEFLDFLRKKWKNLK